MSSSSNDSSSSGEHSIVAAMFFDQTYLAVQKSMCDQGFEIFRNGLRRLCEIAVRSTNVARTHNPLTDTLHNCFPPHPDKVRHEDWDRFEAFLGTDDGERIRDLCTPWCLYGRQAIETCGSCRLSCSTLAELTESEDGDGDEGDGDDDESDDGSDDGVSVFTKWILQREIH